MNKCAYSFRGRDTTIRSDWFPAKEMYQLFDTG